MEERLTRPPSPVEDNRAAGSAAISEMVISNSVFFLKKKRLEGLRSEWKAMQGCVLLCEQWLQKNNAGFRCSPQNRY